MSNVNVDMFAIEGPIPVVAGDEVVITATYAGATTLNVSSGTMEIFKNGSNTDIGSTHLVSGDSLSVSNNQLTSKKITGLVGGNTYVVCFGVDVDGLLLHNKVVLQCQKKGSF